MNNNSDSITDLEKELTSTGIIEDGDISCESLVSGQNSTLSNKKLVKCLVCLKEFDSTDAEADPINLICSLCYISLASFPQFGKSTSSQRDTPFSRGYLPAGRVTRIH